MRWIWWARYIIVYDVEIGEFILGVQKGNEVAVPVKIAMELSKPKCAIIQYPCRPPVRSTIDIDVQITESGCFLQS